MGRRALALMVSLLAAGCATLAPAPEAPTATPPLIESPFAQSHDHGDATLHRDALGTTLLGSHLLAPEGATRETWLTSELIIRGDLAVVGYVGAPWLIATVGVSDPAAPRLLAQMPYTNAWAMDVAVSEDAKWAFVSVYPGAAIAFFDPNEVPRTLAAPEGIPAPGIAVIDLADPAAPGLSSYFPIHGLGAHTAVYHRYESGREIILANKADPAPGSGTLILDVVTTPTGDRVLKPLSFWAIEGAGSDLFPHDLDVQTHPIDGRTYASIAYWDAGLVLLDITDPAAPAMVGQGRDAPAGEELQIHDARAYPTLVGGRHYTVTTPEIPSGDATGHMRVWDTTDPAHPTHAASWILPGEHVVDEPFGYSPHNHQYLPDGRLALAHGHAGTWILRWHEGDALLAEPRAEAYYAASINPAPPPAWAPVKGNPWHWGTAIADDGTLWISDTMGGLAAVRVDG